MALALKNREQSLSSLITINRRLISYYAWRCEQALATIMSVAAGRDKVAGFDITLARWEIGLRMEMVSFAFPNVSALTLSRKPFATALAASPSSASPTSSSPTSSARSATPPSLGPSHGSTSSRYSRSRRSPRRHPCSYRSCTQKPSPRGGLGQTTSTLR